MQLHGPFEVYAHYCNSNFNLVNVDVLMAKFTRFEIYQEKKKSKPKFRIQNAEFTNDDQMPKFQTAVC